MTREEYIDNEKQRISGLDWRSDEDNESEVRFHRLFSEIMTDDRTANVLLSMLSPFYRRFLPSHAVDESHVDEIAGFPIGYDVLDDGELHILHDLETDTWVIDNTYDFWMQAKKACELYGMDWQNAEAVIGSNLNGAFSPVNAVLECIRSGDFGDLNGKFKTVNVKKFAEERR